jgi:hypothetical protein
LASKRLWLKLLQIFFVIVVVAMFVLLRTFDSDAYNSGGQSNTIQAFIHKILPWFLVPGLIGVFILILKYGAKHGVVLPRDPPLSNADPISSRGFPVIQQNDEYAKSIDESGQYRIDGVNRETKMETTLHVRATSIANAKVKAELDGIIITSIKKIA